MRMLAMLIRPTSGQVLIDGMDLMQRAQDIRKLIGYLPQSFMAHPSMTGREFMNYIGVMKGMHHASERSRQITDMMEEVGLSSKLDDRISIYSGSMVQQLGIAQAMLGNPPILIIDEPTIVYMGAPRELISLAERKVWSAVLSDDLSREAGIKCSSSIRDD